MLGLAIFRRRLIYRVLVPVAFGVTFEAQNIAKAEIQWQPSKNIEFIVGTAAGGSFDQTARSVQAILQERKIVSLPVTVVNKPGGAETISRTYLNMHAGDGHYLEFTSGNIFSNYIIGKNPLTYTDVTPIVMLYSEATAIAVNANSSLKSAHDLVTRLRQDPQSLSFAVGSALGTVPHIAVGLIAKAAGADAKKLKAVVFRSSGESVAALLGGHIDAMAGAVSLVHSYVKAGKLSLIGIASTERLPGMLNDVPTLKEQGIDAVVTNFRGVFGPRNLDRASIAYWEQTLYTVTQTAEWKKQLDINLWENSFMRNEEFTRFLEIENGRTKAFLKELDLVK